MRNLSFEVFKVYQIIAFLWEKSNITAKFKQNEFCNFCKKFGIFVIEIGQITTNLPIQGKLKFCQIRQTFLKKSEIQTTCKLSFLLENLMKTQFRKFVKFHEIWMRI